MHVECGWWNALNHLAALYACLLDEPQSRFSLFSQLQSALMGFFCAYCLQL